MSQKRTIRGWFDYLDDPKREMDLSEFMGMMLMHIREYTKLSMEDAHQSRQAAEHTEGMLTRMDLLLATLSQTTGLPYPSQEQLEAELTERSRVRQQQLSGAAANGSVP